MAIDFEQVLDEIQIEQELNNYLLPRILQMTSKAIDEFNEENHGIQVHKIAVGIVDWEVDIVST